MNRQNEANIFLHLNSKVLLTSLTYTTTDLENQVRRKAKHFGGDMVMFLE